MYDCGSDITKYKHEATDIDETVRRTSRSCRRCLPQFCKTIYFIFRDHRLCYSIPQNGK